MGNPKQKWTAEEEEALLAGIAKYGLGKWKFIQRDPEFNRFLQSRNNIDLKDKWRNISAAAGQGSRTPRAKSSQESAATPMLNAQAPVPAPQELPAHPVTEDSSKELSDAKNGPRYNEMVFEALSTTKEPHGLDISALVSFIEQRVDVPQKFRKLLGSRLRRLVGQNKLEKIDNCYRIKEVKEIIDKSSCEPKQVIQKEIWSRESQYTLNGQSVEAAARLASMNIAKAEELSFQADEAVREAERVAKMAEEAADVLQLANEIFERCTQGEVVAVA